MARGALCLDPVAAQPWAVLGTVGLSAALRQHALIRCLHLQPQHAPAWAALAMVGEHMPEICEFSITGISKLTGAVHWLSGTRLCTTS